jgi:hypothetical protein
MQNIMLKAIPARAITPPSIPTTIGTVLFVLMSLEACGLLLVAREAGTVVRDGEESGPFDVDEADGTEAVAP